MAQATSLAKNLLCGPCMYCSWGCIRVDGQAVPGICGIVGGGYHRAPMPRPGTKRASTLAMLQEGVRKTPAEAGVPVLQVKPCYSALPPNLWVYCRLMVRPTLSNQDTS